MRQRLVLAGAVLALVVAGVLVYEQHQTPGGSRVFGTLILVLTMVLVGFGVVWSRGRRRSSK